MPKGGNQGGKCRGGGSQGMGKGGGRGGPGGTCVCSECGHEEPHRQGTPCIQVQCPKCGRTMTRKQS